MSNHREKFLSNIKASLQTTLLPEAKTEHPGSFQDYSFHAEAATAELVEDFKRELEVLSGHVYILEDIEETARQILTILESHQAQRIIAWDDTALGLPNLKASLIEAGVVIEVGTLSTVKAERETQLAAMDDALVGLTGALAGLADTGAIALTSGPGQGRLASLLPPVHVALLSKRKLYPSLPAFLANNTTAATESSNLVFIAGPSRTGDIEMTLSMGVHGPGEVHVIITP